MTKFRTLIGATLIAAAFGSTAFAASPDVYVVKFRADSDVKSQTLDTELATAIAIAGANVEEVTIDTSNAARWEKSAHEAFDRGIVPVFNKWVGLPGFAAVVDAKSKRVLGCVNSTFDANTMAAELRKMSAKASGSAYMSNASTRMTTQCPPTFNVDPGL